MILSRLNDWYFGIKHVNITNRLLANVESRYDECSTRDFRTLQKYIVHSRMRMAASIVLGLSVFKLRQYPNFRRLIPISPDILAVGTTTGFYTVSAAACMRNKTGDFLFPPPQIEISNICQDARNFYKYHCPNDFVRLQQKFPSNTREDFSPKDDGYHWLARRAHKVLE